MAGSTVRQVVAVDGCDDRMLEAEAGHGICNAPRFPSIHAGRQPRGHGAESAAARADLPEDHEGRRPVSSPALVDVGAAGLLADSVKAQLIHERPQLQVAGVGLARGQSDPQPFGTGRPRILVRLRVAAGSGRGLHHGALPLSNDRGSTSARAPAATIRLPKTSPKRRATGPEISSRPTGLPSRRSSDVISQPAIPQGTMARNPPRFPPTLSAKPCDVTQRDSRTPIDAIFAGPNHTPVKPGLRWARMPTSESARISTLSRSRR